MSKLVDDNPAIFVKYHRGFYALAGEAVRKLKRDRDTVKVTLLFGLPGCGKTRFVLDRHPDAYVHEPGSPWFDGYTGQDVLLLDDFAGSGSGYRLDKTLVLLDKYQPRLPIKGGHTYLLATHVYVTTNIHPRDWFKWEGRDVQWLALARRFDEVYVFEESTPVLLGDAEHEHFWGPDPHGEKFGDLLVPMPRVY